MPAPKIARYLALILAVAAVVLVLKGQEHDDVTALRRQMDGQQAQLAQFRKHAEAMSAQFAEHAREATASCPYGAMECIVMPSTRQYGLVIDGNSRSFGGIPLAVADYHNALEMWMQGGSLYVLAKPGWIGGQLCVDVAFKANYCLTYSDIAWIHAHGG